jgi:hypothetical protein
LNPLRLLKKYSLVRNIGEVAPKKPFYSSVDKAIEEIVKKQPKATGDQYLGMMLKSKGVKPAEVKDRGLESALKRKGKMTWQDLVKVAEENPPPQITSKTLTGDTYKKYRTPGGENYREILIKLPQEKKEVKPVTVQDLKDQGYEISNFKYDPKSNTSSYKIRNIESVSEPFGKVSERKDIPGVAYPEQAYIYEAQKLSNILDEKANKPLYKSEHFGEEGGNLLAHARVQDMRGPNDEKILLIDEIQSDWHQTGRKQGYKSEGDEKVADTATDDLRVSDAPFKKNWHELVMKRLVDDAAKKGYDRVIITPGEEHALRYEKPELTEGMQGFYDQMLPSYIKKQYGVEVGQHPVMVDNYQVVRDNYGKEFAVTTKLGTTISKYPTLEEAQAAALKMNEIPYHSFDITPEMRQSIIEKGQPLYQMAPVGVGAAAISEEEPMPYKKGGKIKKPISMDAMRLAVMKRK